MDYTHSDNSSPAPPVLSGVPQAMLPPQTAPVDSGGPTDVSMQPHFITSDSSAMLFGSPEGDSSMTESSTLIKRSKS